METFDLFHEDGRVIDSHLTGSVNEALKVPGIVRLTASCPVESDVSKPLRDEEPGSDVCSPKTPGAPFSAHPYSSRIKVSFHFN